MTLVSILLMIALMGLIGLVAYLASEGIREYRRRHSRDDADQTRKGR